LLLLSSGPVRGQIAGPVPKASPVQKITLQHVGQATASDALIRANIRLRLGDPYSRKASDDDIHNLRNTGFFENVYVTDKQVAGGVEVTYTLVGKPVVTVNLTPRPDPMPFASSGAALGARDAQSLSRCLHQILSGAALPQLRRAQQDFLREHYAHIGSSAHHTAQLIKRFVDLAAHRAKPGNGRKQR